MVSETVRSRWRRVGVGIGLLALAGGLLVLAIPAMPTRAYPRRAPVRFWHMWTGQWKDVIEQIVTRFNESQDRYEVIAVAMPFMSGESGSDVKFLTAIAGGDPPDCIAQWNPVIPTWANNGLLIPLDELMTPEERDRFAREAYPIIKKIGMYRGRLYGVTTGLNVFACYYRPDQLREAGLDPDHFPQRLEELVAWGEKLDRYDSHGDLTRLGFLPAGCTMYAPLFGGGFYDEQTQKVTLDTPANLRALKFLADARQRIGFDKLVRFGSGLNQGFDIEWPFVTGSLAITVDGQWRVEQIRRYAPDLDYRVAPIPPPAGGKKLAGWASGNFMIVPRGARQAKGAWEFIKFWSGLDQPERAAEFYTWGGWLPLSPAIAASPTYQAYLQKYPQFRTFLELLPSENIQTSPPVPYQTYLSDALSRTEDLVVRGTLTPEAALHRLELDVHKEQQRRKSLGYAE